MDNIFESFLKEGTIDPKPREDPIVEQQDTLVIPNEDSLFTVEEQTPVVEPMSLFEQ